jgi:transcriptional regulator with GAF, ATPase, and Fis domain
VNGVINLDLALPGHDQEINESENFININNSKDSKILTVKQLSEIESNNIVNALNKTNWKVSGEKGAAKLLGMPSTTLSSRMKALNIKKV